MHRAIVPGVLSLLAGSARAEYPVVPPENLVIEPARPALELQADLGLAVIGVGVERALTEHVALQGEAFITGTYFLPWFDLGPNVTGFGGGARLTWLEHPYGRGLYGVALLRFSGVHAEGGDAFLMTELGAAAGYAFPIANRLSLRLGLGVIAFHGTGVTQRAGLMETANLGTPFVQLDAVIAYRL